MGNVSSIEYDFDEKEPDIVATPLSKWVLIRLIIWTVVLITIIQIVVYFTMPDLREPLARQTEVITGKGLILKCSSEYKKRLDKYEGCAPKECERFITDKVVSTREADELLNMATFFFKFGGPVGGTSKFDLHSGFLTKELFFVNLYGMEETKLAITENDIFTFKMVKEKIKSIIASHFDVQNTKIYMTNPTLFSEVTPKKGAIIHDDWLPHDENETDHSIYSTVLYLGDYNVDFKGGRLIFNDNKDNSTVEAKKGRLCIFTSGEENAHHVEEVTWGARYALDISFTCDEKYAIPDPDVNGYDKRNVK